MLERCKSALFVCLRILLNCLVTLVAVLIKLLPSTSRSIHVSAAIDNQSPDNSVVISNFDEHDAMFRAAFENGDLPDAASHGRLALAELRTEAVKDGPNEHLATYLSNIGEVCRRIGDHNRARAYLEESVAIGTQLGLKPTLEEGMLSSINNLALVYADMGDHAAAERLYKQSLESVPAGQAHVQSVRVLNNLASLYGDMGKPMEKELTFEKALAMAAKVFDMDVALHTNVLNNYASTLMDGKSWERSRALYLRALAVQERACKGVSLDAARTHNDLGVMEQKLGDLTAAKNHFERALHLKQICVPDELLDIAESEHNLGGVYFEQGDFEQAARMAQRLVATYTEALGASHALTEQARANLAAIPREYALQ
jgi:tetratricopeptide (TPR) repeat protein